MIMLLHLLYNEIHMHASVKTLKNTACDYFHRYISQKIVNYGVTYIFYSDIMPSTE